jgi:hypothetical protein
MRELAACLIVLSASACKFGEHIAEAPVDGPALTDGDGGGDIDAGDTTGDGPDASSGCQPGADGDRDNIPDCTEEMDGDPFTDPAKFNGLHAIIGDLPFSGTCSDLDDYAEMEGRFDTPVQEQDVYAGWNIDTDANTYNDPSFGFQPNWPMAQSGRFSVRFRGVISLAAGDHCFQVDIGATGTGIIDGHNTCGQVYVGVGGLPTAALAETGFGAPADGPGLGCITVPSAGAYPIDIVLWLWEVNLWRTKLAVTHCTGVGCTPTEQIPATRLQAAR